jgi:nicotinate phosphoribosyltransferase
MCFPSEREAFQAYAEAMPGNCILLVDTYGTEQGIENAIETAHWLADHGHRLNGVRLDSGDLDALSRMARERLDNAGLQDVAIVGSNDLDEHAVAELKRKGAPIRVWGVGTRLATGYADAALGGVYKLTAIQDEHGQWLGKLKLSDEATKSSLPGHALQVRRVLDRNGLFAGDIVYQEPGAPLPGSTVHDLISGKPLFTLTADAVATDLLGPVFIDGRCVYDPLALAAVRDRCQEQLRLVPEQVRRLQEPAVYPVGMEQGLESVRRTLRDQFSSSGGHPGE